MNKLTLTMIEIKRLHEADQLDEAEAGYLDWLAVYPEDVDAMHWLAILYAQQGRLDESKSLFERAVALAPDQVSLQLHWANILKAKGLLDQAIAVLLALTQAHPQFAAAYNNLGTIYYARSEWQLAAEAFQSAIDQQAGYVDAYFNLGLALSKLGRHEAARHAYEAVLAFDPQHVGAKFQMGSLLMWLKNEKAAIKYFAEIEREHPFHLETQLNLAACYLRLSQAASAKTHYLRALDIAPDDKQALYNLGVIEMQLGDVKAAIQYYLRAVKEDPDYFEAQHNLGTAYVAIKDRASAILHYREALRLQPMNEAIRHTIAILEHDKGRSGSPAAYVQSLFDSYAAHYEQHLHSLGYQVPQLFYQLLVTAAGDGAAAWDVLDLGCGTGWCGSLFKAYAHRLVGVDLSANMLEIAARKHCYDELVEADMMAFMRETTTSYDLVLAADVLVYFGRLDEVISLVRRVLRPDGLFVLNLEACDQGDYLMTSSGRFAHNMKYVESLFAENRMSVVAYQAVVLREQDHQPVAGHLYLVRRVI